MAPLDGVLPLVAAEGRTELHFDATYVVLEIIVARASVTPCPLLDQWYLLLSAL